MKGEQPLPFLEVSPEALQGSTTLSKEEMCKKKGAFRLKTRREQVQILMGIAPELVRYSKEERRTVFFPGGDGGWVEGGDE